MDASVDLERRWSICRYVDHHVTRMQHGTKCCPLLLEDTGDWILTSNLIGILCNQRKIGYLKTIREIGLEINCF